MKNHTPKAQTTNPGLSEIPTSKTAKPSFDSFDTLSAKLTDAVVNGAKDEDGLPFIETDDQLIRYYLKKPGQYEEFEKVGYFLMNGVKVKRKDG